MKLAVLGRLSLGHLLEHATFGWLTYFSYKTQNNKCISYLGNDGWSQSYKPLPLRASDCGAHHGRKAGLKSFPRLMDSDAGQSLSRVRIGQILVSVHQQILTLMHPRCHALRIRWMQMQLGSGSTRRIPLRGYALHLLVHLVALPTSMARHSGIRIQK